MTNTTTKLNCILIYYTFLFMQQSRMGDTLARVVSTYVGSTRTLHIMNDYYQHHVHATGDEQYVYMLYFIRTQWAL